MNEKIKELYDQAYCDAGGFVGASEHMSKFAELIVEECAGLVDHVIMEDGTRRSDFIRKHFGIKE